MRIRRAQHSEAEVLSSIAFESKAYWSYAAAQLEAWRSALTVSRQMLAQNLAWVAEDEEGILGFFVLDSSTPHWTLEHCWVRPGSMGRGVGRAMLGRALELASKSGAQAIAIDADPQAEKFYLACGARRVGSMAAPIDGAPDRVRPQLLLAVHHLRFPDSA